MKKLHAELLIHKVEGSTEEIWGAYLIRHPIISDYIFYVRVGDGLGWDHVSVSLLTQKKKLRKSVKRCPTWDEMCFIKNLFFDESETVVQYHPAGSEYVNLHQYVLHLWKPQNEKLPNPLPVQV
jgi:hypothetical protein